MIVDYEYYLANGGTLTQSQFDKFEPKAERKINVVTGGKDLTQFLEPVKQAICEMIDIYYNKSLAETELNNMQTGDSISSEKVGSYSITYNKLGYAEMKDKLSNYDKEIEDTITEHLYTTGLLYCGMPNVRY